MKDVKKNFDYVKTNRTTSRRCRNCDYIILKEPKKECYPYFCSKCDKYLFENETYESYRKASADEIFDLLEATRLSTKNENI